jgi:pyruvate/2-oxoglutarate dehydrogenase complex dihydrolipoamide acyltransferase (E2) component
VDISVPDLGDFADVEIIEVLVKVGDRIEPEDPLVSLETDKATMDVPSPAAGSVTEIKVAVGDRVSTGDVLIVLEGDGDGDSDGDGDGGRDRCRGDVSATGAWGAGASPG